MVLHDAQSDIPPSVTILGMFEENSRSIGKAAEFVTVAVRPTIGLRADCLVPVNPGS